MDDAIPGTLRGSIALLGPQVYYERKRSVKQHDVNMRLSLAWRLNIEAVYSVRSTCRADIRSTWTGTAGQYRDDPGERDPCREQTWSGCQAGQGPARLVVAWDPSRQGSNPPARIDRAPSATMDDSRPAHSSTVSPVDAWPQCCNSCAVIRRCGCPLALLTVRYSAPTSSGMGRRAYPPLLRAAC